MKPMRDEVKMNRPIKKHKSGHDLNDMDQDGYIDTFNSMNESFYSNWIMPPFAQNLDSDGQK